MEKELHRMQPVGVISLVDKLSPWCAGMVVIPKPSGDVQICVNLEPLNQNVLQEYYPLSNVDETPAQLAGAKKLIVNLMPIVIFGKYHLLNNQSHLAFITPFRRFQFNKLSFGISCALEHYLMDDKESFV